MKSQNSKTWRNHNRRFRLNLFFCFFVFAELALSWDDDHDDDDGKAGMMLYLKKKNYINRIYARDMYLDARARD